jgi:hypothetical protein
VKRGGGKVAGGGSRGTAGAYSPFWAVVGEVDQRWWDGPGGRGEEEDWVVASPGAREVRLLVVFRVAFRAA